MPANTKEYNAAMYKKNKVRWNKICTAKYRYRKTGFTQEDYDRAYYEQRGVCKLCGNTDPKRALSADHNHATGVKRGLLCSACNLGLGSFKDNIELLKLAIKYLQDHG